MAAASSSPADMDINYQSVISEISMLLEVLGASGARKAVSEVFSPGRFVNQAGVFGMIPGSAYDLSLIHISEPTRPY